MSTNATGWSEDSVVMRVGNHIVVAAERTDKPGISGGRQPDHPYILAQPMQQMRQSERRLAGSAGEHHAARAEEFILRKVIVDQEREHEQRTQQRLVIALSAGESGIAGDARIGVVDRRNALTMRGGIAQ